MKTTIKNTFVSLLIVAAMTVSCNKSKTENDGTTDQENISVTDTTVIKSGENSDASTSNGQSAIDAQTSTTSGNDNKTATKKSGLSAPDGTNKENHDGDMYTKNDTTRMPTGTSIK